MMQRQRRQPRSQQGRKRTTWYKAIQKSSIRYKSQLLHTRNSSVSSCSDTVPANARQQQPMTVKKTRAEQEPFLNNGIRSQTETSAQVEEEEKKKGEPLPENQSLPPSCESDEDEVVVVQPKKRRKNLTVTDRPTALERLMGNSDENPPSNQKQKKKASLFDYMKPTSQSLRNKARSLPHKGQSQCRITAFGAQSPTSSDTENDNDEDTQSVDKDTEEHKCRSTLDFTNVSMAQGKQRPKIPWQPNANRSVLDLVWLARTRSLGRSNWQALRKAPMRKFFKTRDGHISVASTSIIEVLGGAWSQLPNVEFGCNAPIHAVEVHPHLNLACAGLAHGRIGFLRWNDDELANGANTVPILTTIMPICPEPLTSRIGPVLSIKWITHGSVELLWVCGQFCPQFAGSLYEVTMENGLDVRPLSSLFLKQLPPAAESEFKTRMSHPGHDPVWERPSDRFSQTFRSNKIKTECVKSACICIHARLGLIRAALSTNSNKLFSWKLENFRSSFKVVYPKWRLDTRETPNSLFVLNRQGCLHKAIASSLGSSEANPFDDRHPSFSQTSRDTVSTHLKMANRFARRLFLRENSAPVHPSYQASEVLPAKFSRRVDPRGGTASLSAQAYAFYSNPILETFLKDFDRQDNRSVTALKVVNNQRDEASLLVGYKNGTVMCFDCDQMDSPNLGNPSAKTPLLKYSFSVPQLLLCPLGVAVTTNNGSENLSTAAREVVFASLLSYLANCHSPQSIPGVCAVSHFVVINEDDMIVCMSDKTSLRVHPFSGHCSKIFYPSNACYSDYVRKIADVNTEPGQSTSGDSNGQFPISAVNQPDGTGYLKWKFLPEFDVLVVSDSLYGCVEVLDFTTDCLHDNIVHERERSDERVFCKACPKVASCLRKNTFVLHSATTMRAESATLLKLLTFSYSEGSSIHINYLTV